METHNAEGQKVEFTYTTQPSKSRGFRRLVAAGARSATNAAVALGGGLVRLIPNESGKMLMGLALATPVGALDAAAQRLEHDPEEVDQVYHRRVEDGGRGRGLVSETVLLHPDGSYEYLAAGGSRLSRSVSWLQYRRIPACAEANNPRGSRPPPEKRPPARTPHPPAKADGCPATPPASPPLKDDAHLLPLHRVRPLDADGGQPPGRRDVTLVRRLEQALHGCFDFLSAFGCALALFFGYFLDQVVEVFV